MKESEAIPGALSSAVTSEAALSPFRQPQFLSDNDHPRHRIRCPVHGFIHFSENERAVIDHELFRRLRFIRQLALTELIYPGATHTRFEHSLGVMEVATRAFDRLAQRRGDLLEATFGQVDGYRDAPLAKARQVLRLASLLHDVGHSCFSHPAEPVIHQGAGHEELTLKVVTGKDEKKNWLGHTLDGTFFDGCSGFVGKVIKGGAELPPQLQILHDLVSGQIDADRTDYLLRDSHHCGVDYGRFDHRRMIECLELRESEGGILEMALHEDGIQTFEALILARYQMSTQVYFHRLRRIYDLYLCNYFAAKGAGFFDTPEKVLAENDVTMMTALFRDAASAGDPGQTWAARIVLRTHHREVFHTGEGADAMDLRHAKATAQKLRERFPDHEFLVDLPPKPVSIHKLLIPGDRDEDGRTLFPLVGPRGPKGFVGERSCILRNIPREFQVCRIFCDLARAQKTRQEEIANFAYSSYREMGGRS